jgi:hypothetical protein
LPSLFQSFGDPPFSPELRTAFLAARGVDALRLTRVTHEQLYAEDE